MRLIVVVEGQTEEAVVGRILSPYLNQLGVFVSVTIVGKQAQSKRSKKNGTPSGRGGGRYVRWRKDLAHILRGDHGKDLRVTTLFDLYGLPDDFPEFKACSTITDTIKRCEQLEEALSRDIQDLRLVPYLQRHELEALVLASIDHLEDDFEDEDALEAIEKLRRDITALKPEEVNDGPQTAPSKRLAAIRGYRKVLHGPNAMEKAGLSHLRAQCPRFNEWIEKLEKLA